MTRPLRARIVAVVSSEDQAADDRASLPLQVERAREAIQRHGWLEVSDPICIWQSRDFYSLEALRAASPEYDQLCLQAEAGALDVIVGRDHSRVLGRTEALQTAIRTHLQLCRVQFYFYTAPVEPIPPEQLGRRGRGQIGARYLDAIAAVRDEEEIARLTQRREDSMNAHVQAGRWRLAAWPFGYTRPILAVIDDRHILGALEVVPDEADLVRDIYRLFLQGYSYRMCYQYLCAARGIQPSVNRAASWPVDRIIPNPIYVGIFVYGMYRNDVATVDGAMRKVRKRHLTRPRRAELALEWLAGRDARTEEEIAVGIIVSWGQWEPIIDQEQWIAAQEERLRRGTASTYMGPDRTIHPLSGLLYCGACNSSLSIGSYCYQYKSSKERKASEAWAKSPIYRCHADIRTKDRACKQPGRIEKRLLEELFGILARYAREHELLEQVLVQSPPDVEAEHRAREAERLEKQIRTAEQAMARWDAAFEAGDIWLEEWRERVGPHRARKEEAHLALKSLQREAQKQEEPTRRALRLRALLEELDQLGPQSEDRRTMKSLLRQLLKKVVVQDKRIVRIEFN